MHVQLKSKVHKYSPFPGPNSLMNSIVFLGTVQLSSSGLTQQFVCFSYIGFFCNFSRSTEVDICFDFKLRRRYRISPTIRITRTASAAKAIIRTNVIWPNKLLDESASTTAFTTKTNNEYKQCYKTTLLLFIKLSNPMWTAYCHSYWPNSGWHLHVHVSWVFKNEVTTRSISTRT